MKERRTFPLPVLAPHRSYRNTPATTPHNGSGMIPYNATDVVGARQAVKDMIPQSAPVVKSVVARGSDNFAHRLLLGIDNFSPSSTKY